MIDIKHNRADDLIANYLTQQREYAAVANTLNVIDYFNTNFCNVLRKYQQNYLSLIGLRNAS